MRVEGVSDSACGSSSSGRRLCIYTAGAIEALYADECSTPIKGRGNEPPVFAFAEEESP